MLCAAVFGVALSLVRESDPGCSLLQDVQDYETYCPSEYDADDLRCETHVVCPITTDCVPAERLLRLEREGGRHCYDAEALARWVRAQRQRREVPTSPLTREELHVDDIARIQAAGYPTEPGPEELPEPVYPSEAGGVPRPEWWPPGLEWRTGLEDGAGEDEQEDGAGVPGANTVEEEEVTRAGYPVVPFLSGLRDAGRAAARAAGRSVLSLRSWRSHAPGLDCFQCGTLAGRCLMPGFPNSWQVLGGLGRGRHLTFSSNIGHERRAVNPNSTYTNMMFEYDVYTCQHVLGTSRNNPIDVGVAGCYPFYVQCPAERWHLDTDNLYDVAPEKFLRAIGGVWFEDMIEISLPRPLIDSLNNYLAGLWP
jgi:hypothetical protein